MKVPFVASALLFACAIKCRTAARFPSRHECRMDAETEVFVRIPLSSSRRRKSRTRMMVSMTIIHRVVIGLKLVNVIRTQSKLQRHWDRVARRVVPSGLFGNAVDGYCIGAGASKVESYSLSFL
jgi:hypothetical protein